MVSPSRDLSEAPAVALFPRPSSLETPSRLSVGLIPRRAALFFSRALMQIVPAFRGKPAHRRRWYVSRRSTWRAGL